MRVRFNVLECCSTDLRRHCHRCPLSRHSRIRRPWMLYPPCPCRQRRHKGHRFGSFIVRMSRNIVIHAGCGIVSTSGSESFWVRPSWKPVWLQAVVVLFPSVFGGSCLANWIRLIGSLPQHHRNNICPFDVVAKRFVVWWERSKVARLDCSQGIFLINSAIAYEGLVPCFVYV